jgi:hypothetical protein
MAVVLRLETAMRNWQAVSDRFLGNHEFVLAKVMRSADFDPGTPAARNSQRRKGAGVCNAALPDASSLQRGVHAYQWSDGLVLRSKTISIAAPSSVTAQTLT